MLRSTRLQKIPSITISVTSPPVNIIEPFHKNILFTTKNALTLRTFQYRYSNSNSNNKKPSSTSTSQSQKSLLNELNNQSNDSGHGITEQYRKDRIIGRKKYEQQTQLHKYNKAIKEKLVELTIYMNHRDWRSQYIYLLLNYYKLGFKVISDYHFLDSASYNLELRKLKEEERWPAIRVIIGLRPKIIMTGREEIERFFYENMYFRQVLNAEGNEVLKNHIDEKVLPYMESLLWHPTLTYQTVMHTEKYYFTADQKNYMGIGVLGRNIANISKEVFKNLRNIAKDKEKYLRSKEIFEKEIRELTELYLMKNEYFGGAEPNFIDFYLYAHLRTKWNSVYFKNFIVEDIGADFRSWLLRMGWSCEYVKDRVTLL